jgi:hypothetical protein
VLRVPPLGVAGGSAGEGEGKASGGSDGNRSGGMTTTNTLAAAFLADTLVRTHGATLRTMSSRTEYKCDDCRVLGNVPVSEWALCNRHLRQLRASGACAEWLIPCARCGGDERSRIHLYGMAAGTRDTPDCFCPRCGVNLSEDFWLVMKE